MVLARQVFLFSVLVLLSGCAEGELILPGERLDIRAPIPAETTEDATVEDIAAAAIDNSELPTTGAGTRPVPINLPGQIANSEWTHRGGSATHRIGHVALGQGLSRVWSSSVGRGSSRKNRITADPIIGAGRIYTMDSTAVVTATGTSGGAVWRTDLTPASDKSGDASGGGLAYGNGRVYATSGFGELVALDAGSGAVQWRQRFDAAVGGAPTVDGDSVYVVARDGSAWAVRASDGKVQWQVAGTASQSGVAGVSAPAISGDFVVFPFTSGQMLAVDRATGTPVWQAYVAGARIGRAYARVSDLTGDPVVADGIVYAGSSAGRLAAIYADSGQPVWSATEGALGPVQIAGGQLFMVNDEDQLLRVDAGSGQVVWRIDLPYFTKDRDKRRKGIYVHYGPVLAGGRLWTASSDGYLRAFDPASGALAGAAEIPGGAASAPVVAGGTLYVMSQGGQLHAFR